MKNYKYRKTITFDGKRYNIYGDTLQEVATKQAQKLNELKTNTVIKSPQMTVQQWAVIWLETYKKNVSKATKGIYQTNLRLHILPFIGGKRLKDVKKSDCQVVLNELQDCSASHAGKVRYTMSQLFQSAIDDSLLIKSPATKLTLPTSKEGSHRSITDFERRITLQTAETHPAGAWVLTMLYTGMRPQETAALRWQNIDLNTMTIRITESLKKGGTIGEPKSKSGKRVVPLSPPLVEPLKAIRQNSTPFDLVFKSVEGKPLNHGSLRRMWKSFKREMQLNAGCRTFRSQLIPPFPIADDYTAYCLRHTYCTDLQDAGVPINVARELMGHSSIELTSKIYTHMSDTQMVQTAKRLSDFYKQNVV